MIRGAAAKDANVFSRLAYCTRGKHASRSEAGHVSWHAVHMGGPQAALCVLRRCEGGKCAKIIQIYSGCVFLCA